MKIPVCGLLSLLFVISSVHAALPVDAIGRIQKRAELVREILIRNGTSPDYLTVSSHGKGNPLVPTSDGVAEPRNRRVEVIVR